MTTVDGSTARQWLMKSEPDTRMEKGKDVAFSVDHFEAMGTTPWDGTLVSLLWKSALTVTGVRSHEAKKLMKERMRIGDGVLHYHSNCKAPGVAALAEVSKEGYPDHTAWDSSHPYYDARSSSESPTWYMVDITFKLRLAHFVSLKLLQHLASLDSLPAELDYLTADHLVAIKAMALLNRGRLSVQPVSPLAFDAIRLLGERGRFDSLLPAKASRAKKADSTAKPRAKRARKKQEEEDEEEGSEEEVMPVKRKR